MPAKEKDESFLRIKANPVENDLELLFNFYDSEIEKYSVSILDIMGRKMLVGLKLTNLPGMQIEVTNYTKGMYFLQLSKEEEIVHIQKFIKN